MVTICSSVLVCVAMLEMVLSLDQAIVLKFGDNSLRIEKDDQHLGERGGQGRQQFVTGGGER